MRQAVRLISVLTVLAACRGETDSFVHTGELAKLAPLAVSDPAAWTLFDRSASSAYRPDAPIEVTLGDETIVAVKVLGSAPYRITLRSATGSPLGFDPIDLSDLAPGWHTTSTLLRQVRTRIITPSSFRLL